MSILLKDVIAMVPANLNLVWAANGRYTPPFSFTFPINDSNGVPIDATAGTVTPQEHDAKELYVDASGAMIANQVLNLGPVNIDLSVVGQCTVNFTGVVSSQYRSGITYVTIDAQDSAGGPSHTLAYGKINMVQTP